MSFFDKKATVAKPGFNRWLVPPAALAVHLCIGQAYAFSVFNNPLAEYGGWGQHWYDKTSLIFAIAIFFLGVSAAFGGSWLEKVGPRKTMFTAACCFGGGFFVATLGIYLQNLWVIFLGYGVLSGCGLGLGYVSPVSTLIKWFPDRRGLATGLAIMGFGGGAMIGAPLGETLMEFYKSNQGILPPAITDNYGLMGTFLTMGTVYFLSMVLGSITIRIPATDWKPDGWTPPAEDAEEATKKSSMVTQNHVHLNSSHKTYQFWLLWLVLYLNVTAGIGILSQASPMIQAMFSVEAAIAAGFVGFLSIFNMGGRLVWSAASDVMGRKNAYFFYFIVGMICYILIPQSKALGSVAMFVCLCAAIISFYGGGFSTIPAYLADMFGTRYVGAIHGRLLTAWSLAGLSGATIVNGLVDVRISQNVIPAMAENPALSLEEAQKLVAGNSYDLAMYVMAGLLVVGVICNFLVRPVAAKFHMTKEQLAEYDPLAGAGDH